MKDEIKPEVAIIQKKGKVLADVVTGVLAPAIGTIAAGPLGSVIGGVAGVIIKGQLEDWIGRWLTPKEVKRLGTSAEYIIQGINEKLVQGESLNERIFQSENGEVSDAEELFEGVLLKCKNSYQEKKVKYISNIFINASINSNISATTANEILSIAEGLTFRRLAILAFFGVKDEAYDIELLMKEPYVWYPAATYSGELEILKQDIAELISQGLINNSAALFSSNDIIPATCTLSSIGKLIFEVMGLGSMEASHMNEVYEGLQYKAEFGLSERGLANGKTV